MRSRPAAGLAALLALISCDGGSNSAPPPCEPAATPLAGLVGAAEWFQVSGAAAPSPVDPAEGVLDFYAVPLTISPSCVPLGVIDSNFVMVRLPASRVRVGMDEVVDLWFCIETGTSAVCGEPGRGVLRIDARDGDTMTGALCGSKGGDHVSGTFTIPDCFP